MGQTAPTGSRDAQATPVKREATAVQEQREAAAVPTARQADEEDREELVILRLVNPGRTAPPPSVVSLAA